MNDSLLPDILDVAAKHSLRETRHKAPRGDKRFDCPFCLANLGKEDTDGKLYLSSSKGSFHCKRCQAGGGVVRFISLLEHKSEQTVLDELIALKRAERAKDTNKSTPTKATWMNHPAMKLSTLQWRAMGYTGKVTIEDFRRDPDYARRTLQWAWSEWQQFSASKLKDVFKWYVAAEYTNDQDYYRGKCSDLEREFGLEGLWEKAKRMYDLPCRSWPDWALHHEYMVLEMHKGVRCNYHEWMSKRRTVCKCHRGTDSTASKKLEIREFVRQLKNSQDHAQVQSVNKNAI